MDDTVGDYVVRPLASATWGDFAAMAERHNGVFGGCWCTWFQTMPAEKERTYEANRSLKQRLVDEGRAHAALAYLGDEVVAWAEYGPPSELPNIYHRKQYDAEQAAEQDVAPDWRITCIFVDKRHRRRGLSDVVLAGALDLIGAAGGGVVEGYPHDNGGQKKAVLYNGTRRLFERAGFAYVRPKGPGNCVMRRTVPAAG